MKSKIYLFAAFLLLTLIGCKKYLELESPNNLTTENFYKTEKDALGAALAMYSNIQHLRYYGNNYFVLTEYPSDDITTKNPVNNWDNFSWSALKTDAYPENDDFFGHIYEGVFRANLVLEKISLNRIDGKEAIPFASETDRNKILAEAYFFRGLNYFNGACFYGGLPILTETPKESKNGGILYTKRSTRLQTFERAIEDLKSAIGEGANANIKLPEAWSADYAGRATIYAGYAMLGKIYLHAGCYFKNQDFFTQSEKYLGLVINSGKFELLPKYADVFSSSNKNNKESVFEIGYGLAGENGFFQDGGTAGENTQRDLRFGVQKGFVGFGELIATQNWVLESEFGDPRVREFLHFTWDTIAFPDSENKRVLPIDPVTGKVKANYTIDLAKTVKETGENEAGSYFHVKKAVDGYEAGGSGGLNGVNNWRLIRYADVLLMYAEVLNELGDANGAITNINKVRQRAANSVPVVNGVKVFRSAKIIRTSRSNAAVGDYTGLYSETTITGAKHDVDPTKDILADYPTLYGIYTGEPVDLTTISKESVRQMIVRERRAELAFEYLRFLDMRRWEALDATHPGAAYAVFQSKNNGNSLFGGNDKQPYNPSVHSLYPIPQLQVDFSKGTLTQNPGY